MRLTPYHYAALQHLADARSWSSSTCLANLFYIHLDAKPRFAADELLALRQVADMGRNVNQNAKSLRC